MGAELEINLLNRWECFVHSSFWEVLGLILHVVSILRLQAELHYTQLLLYGSKPKCTACKYVLLNSKSRVTHSFGMVFFVCFMAASQIDSKSPGHENRDAPNGRCLSLRM